MSACTNIAVRISAAAVATALHAVSWGAWATWRLIFAYLLPHAIITDQLVDLSMSALCRYPRVCHWLDHNRCTWTVVLASLAPIAAAIEAAALLGCSLCVCMTASHSHSEYMQGPGEAVLCLIAAFADFAMQTASAASCAASTAAQTMAWIASSRCLSYVWAVTCIAWLVG